MTLVVGGAVHDRGSSFIAVAAYPCATARQAADALQKLREHAAVVSADARVGAYRACDGGETEDDDGEARAGHQLLIALRKLKVTGVAVVVGRWWNGNIGKARFTHIRERATTLLVACGAKETPDMSQLRWEASGSGRILGGAVTHVEVPHNKHKRRREILAAAADRRRKCKKKGSCSVKSSPLKSPQPPQFQAQGPTIENTGKSNFPEVVDLCDLDEDADGSSPCTNAPEDGSVKELCQLANISSPAAAKLLMDYNGNMKACRATLIDRILGDEVND